MDGSDLRRRNRADNLEMVQRVALELMGRRGFDGVTVVEIAAGAGVSPSTVYRYFGTKEALVLSGDGIDRVIPAVEAAMREEPSAAPAALVGSAIEAALAAADREALLRRLQLVYGDRALTVAFERRVLDRRGELAELLAAHRGKRSTKGRDDALAGAVLGVLLATLDRWRQGDGAKPLTTTWTRAFDATIRQ